jgi:NAD(P)-dependent dehydrogenase (short-subunit alcohol dehydrogenase family)
MRKVLITGATSGVGLAAAKLFSVSSKVVGTTSNAQTVVDFTHSEYNLIKMDLSDSVQRVEGLAKAIELLGGYPDVVIHNAGVGELGAVEDTDLELSLKLFEVNYWGPVWLTKEILPHFRNRASGHFLFMGSIVFELQFPFKAQYCASKSALSAFALSLRHEVEPYGIYTHLLEPGWVRTNFHNALTEISNPETPYGPRLAPFKDFSADQDSKLPDGDDVAQVLLDLVIDPSKPVRQDVGPDCKKFKFAKRFLRNHWIDKIIKKKIIDKK